MKNDLGRIVKGYKPKTDRGSYWFIHYLFGLIAVMKTKFFSMLES